MDTTTFAADRRAVLDAADDELRPLIRRALDGFALGQDDWWQEVVEAAGVLWIETYEKETGRSPTQRELSDYLHRLATSLKATANPGGEPTKAQVNLVTQWVSTFTVNDATTAAAGRGEVLQWVTMHDASVRASHRAVDGQRREAGATFDVDGFALAFPGDPVGPPDVWINCRCVVMRVGGPTMSAEELTFADAGPQPVPTDDPDLDVADGEVPWDDDVFDAPVPWHGVLAPTGVLSGDRRKFLPDALRNRDLPVPVMWQRATAEGHDGAVPIANLTRVWETDGLIKGEGVFHSSAEADEVIALRANHILQGLSVDLDDATFELQNDDGTVFDADTAEPGARPVMVVTDGRIASVTVVPIPAFQEAWFALGTWDDEPDDEPGDGSGDALAADCAPCAAREMDDLLASWEPFAVSDRAWDGSSSRFTPEQWYRSCILHKSNDRANKADHGFPILEPNGDLSRAAVHNAAARINQAKASGAQIASAKRALITAYHKLGEDPPEVLTAGAFPAAEPQPTTTTAAGDVQVTFAPGTHDGPGWVTHPKQTARIRRYWVQGKGAAKIRWGVPGDFNRCRRQLAKYIPNAHFLAGTCANMHKEAISLWPGRETGRRGRHSVDTPPAAPSFNLVAAAAAPRPAGWFTDPHLSGPTPLQVDGDRVFGHLAVWGTCHTGLGLSVGDGDTCVVAPSSASGYAYFHTGEVITDAGPVAVGHITLGTGHAPLSATALPAASHYDNTGAAVADVVAGEDEHGIWLAGAIRPGVDDETVAVLRAAALSGDWRRIGTGRELVAALAVNVPGFPIPRTAVGLAAGQAVSLVAAGVMEPGSGVTSADWKAVLRSVLPQLRRVEAREQLAQQVRAARRRGALERIH